jgi:hypothetical protein
MSVVPIATQLRTALRERTRLENDFKTKILNRINAILEQLNDCDRSALPPTAAGVLNIAIDDLNAIVREIRTPTNMTDADVEQIVEPLERRRRNHSMRLLPAGRPVDGPRDLSAAPSSPSPSAPAGSMFSRFFGSPEAAPAATSSPRGSSIYRDGPPSLFDLDDRDSSSSRFSGSGGWKSNRKTRKYHRKA